MPLLRMAFGSVLATMALATPAQAASYLDRRDASRSRLDIKSVAAGIVGDRMRLTLMTHRSWTSTYLSGPNRYVCFYVWRGGGRAMPGEHDFTVCGTYQGRLHGIATELKTRKATPVTVRRRRGNGIQFEVPTTLIGAQRASWLGVSKDGTSKRGFDIAPSGPRLIDFAPD